MIYTSGRHRIRLSRSAKSPDSSFLPDALVKSPRSMADVFRHARAEHIYLPHPDFDRRTTYRQWSDKQAAFAYDTVPPYYRAVFPRAWQEIWELLRWCDWSSARMRVCARLYIGQYVLAFSRLTGTDVVNSCRFLLEKGFASTFQYRETEEKAAGWHFRGVFGWAGFELVNNSVDRLIVPASDDSSGTSLISWRAFASDGGRRGNNASQPHFFARHDWIKPGNWSFPAESFLLGVKQLRQWAHEADVPDPRAFFMDKWGTAAQCAAVGRAYPSMHMQRNRRRAAVALANGVSVTDAARVELAKLIIEEGALVCNQGGYPLDEYLKGALFWSDIDGIPTSRPSKTGEIG